jgi:hypothetical protein
MKLTILSLIEVVGLIFTNAAAQETMQFTFIGNAGGTHESVIITSVKDLKMNDVEELLVDQRILDTLKSCILRYYIEKRGNVAPTKNGTIDSLNPLSDIKVTGVDSIPLYFNKEAFSELVFSAMRYLRSVNLNHSTVNFVLARLQYLGHEKFFYRDFVDSSRHVDPYLKLKDKSNM